MNEVFINSTEEYLIASLHAFERILDRLKVTDKTERQACLDEFAQYTGLFLGKITTLKIQKAVEKHEKTDKRDLE